MTDEFGDEIEADEFLREVYDGVEGFAWLDSLAGDPRAYYLPDYLTDMVDDAYFSGKGNLYFSTFTFTDGRTEAYTDEATGKRKITTGRQKANAKEGRVLFCDADSAHPDVFRLKPSIVLESSPGRYQTFWILDEVYPAARIALVARQIAYAHVHQGADISSSSLTKLLRVPGSTNSKRNRETGEFVHPDQPIVRAWDTGERYTLAQVEAKYEDITFIRELLPETEDVELPDSEHLEKFTPLYDGLPERSITGTDLAGMIDKAGWLDEEGKPREGSSGDRSRWRYKLICELMREGYDNSQVLVLVWGSKSGEKWRADPRGQRGLWSEILKARIEINGEQGDLDRLESDSAYQESEIGTPLLTDAERALIKDDPHFINRYLHWVKTRLSRANLPYHRINAWQVLSVAYAELTQIPDEARDRPLNFFTITIGETATGKALPLDERVLTPMGWSTMGELSVGDYVVGANGMPTKITGYYPQGKRDVARITFRDGSSVVADWDHRWSAATKVMRSRGQGNRVFTTREIYDRLASNPHVSMRIPMSSPVEYAFQDSPNFDAYSLGAWLGDGSLRANNNAYITTDDWILDKMIQRGVETRARQAAGSAGYCYGATMIGAGKVLSGMDVGSHSWNKRIPSKYLTASVRDRIDLLQGLLDTDGTPSNGGVEWGTVSPGLAEGFQELVQSLGGTATRAVKTPTYTYNGERREGKTFYRFWVNLPEGVDPFTLPRKADLWVKRNLPTRTIVSVEPLSEAVECACIKVDAEDSLYLTRDFIVTHNTDASEMMFSMMHHVHPDQFWGDGGVNVGGDATPTALKKALIDRDAKVSVFQSDEAHGPLGQIQKQEYQTGSLELYTYLYDGRVPKIQRMTSAEASNKDATTIFNMWFLGPPKQVTGVIPLSWFESGFMGRFMCAIGDSPDVNADNMKMRRRKGDLTTKRVDPFVLQIQNEVQHNTEVFLDRGMPYLDETEAALERMAEAHQDMISFAKAHPRLSGPLYEATRRQGLHIRKAAWLLALSEGSAYVTERHALIAIEAAEGWLAALTEIAGMVSTGEYAQQANEIERAIRDNNGWMSKPKIWRRFADLDNRTKQGFVDELTIQGRIIYEKQNGVHGYRARE